MQTSAISIVAAVFVASAALAQRADVLVRPETGEVIPLDGAAQLSHIEPRIPLDPPSPDDPMPPASTALLTITSPGSYFLTGNLNGGSGVYGIDIQSSNVTLDLSGYSMVGLAGSLDAITSTTGGTNILIANGTIRGWGGDGIDGRTLNSVQIANVLVANCTGDGIAISRGLIRDCQVRLCDGTGISVINGEGGVAECRVEECGGRGIDCGEFAAVKDCSSTGNTLEGIRLGRGSTIEDCTSTQNGRDGISVLNHGTVRGCSAFSNSRDGIRGGNRATVSGCTTNTNGACGVYVTGSGVVESCSASLNGDVGIKTSSGVISGCDASDNTSHGIFCFGEGTIADCSATANGEVGIYGQYFLAIRGCSASSNTGYGIQTGACCNLIEDCTASYNGDFSTGVGIRVLTNTTVRNCHLDNNILYVVSAGCRIDSNAVSRSKIQVAGSGSVIVRNCAESFDVAGGNVLGTVQASAAAAGPWDNFEY